jgi:hypothetical protein
MGVVPDLNTSTVGFQPVPGNHDPCGGGDIDQPSTNGLSQSHGRVGELGWHRVLVAAVGDQRLPRHHPGLGEPQWIRDRRDR